MRPASLFIVVFTVVSSLGCATIKPPSLVHGRPVEVRTKTSPAPAKGELIATDEDSLVLCGPAGPRTIPLPEITSVRYKRHGADRRLGFRWALFGSLATGALLWGPCASVEGNSAGDCAVVGAAVGGLYFLLGGLAALTMEHSAFETVRPLSAESLRPYARFPQGLPPDLDLDTLTPPSIRKQHITVEPPAE